MARGYTLGKRGESVARSRARVVAAARALLSRQGYHELSVETVAVAADVSRATVYNQFGSKKGIIEAVFDDIGRRIEFASVYEASQDPDLRRAPQRTLAAYSHAWSRDRRIIGRLFGLVAVDSELETLVQRGERDRQKPVRILVQRLRGQAALAPGVTAREARAVLGVLTSFATHDELARSGLRGSSLVHALLRLAGTVIDFQKLSVDAHAS